MPGSSTVGKLAVSDWYSSLPRHSRVLDIGPGWGTYLRLLKRPGEMWDAVEIHEPYVKRFKLREKYHKVFIEDIRTFKARHRYDVVFLGDILEHLTQKDAVLVLKKVFKITHYCIISIPLDAETGADTNNFEDYWGNPHERHLASWSNRSLQEMFAKLGGELIAQEKYREIGVYLIACGDKLLHLNERKPAPIKNIYFRYSNALDYDPRRVNLFLRRCYGKTMAAVSRLIPNKLKPGLRHLLKLDAPKNS